MLNRVSRSITAFGDRNWLQPSVIAHPRPNSTYSSRPLAHGAQTLETKVCVVIGIASYSADPCAQSGTIRRPFQSSGGALSGAACDVAVGLKQRGPPSRVSCRADRRRGWNPASSSSEFPGPSDGRQSTASLTGGMGLEALAVSDEPMKCTPASAWSRCLTSDNSCWHFHRSER